LAKIIRCAHKASAVLWLMCANRDRWSSITTARSAAAAHGWSRPPFWDREAKQPVPGKFKVKVNAWLLEDFDPHAQPIKVIDGETLW
jgi:hypothetical protein